MKRKENSSEKRSYAVSPPSKRRKTVHDFENIEISPFSNSKIDSKFVNEMKEATKNEVLSIFEYDDITFPVVAPPPVEAKKDISEIENVTAKDLKKQPKQKRELVKRKPPSLPSPNREEPWNPSHLLRRSFAPITQINKKRTIRSEPPRKKSTINQSRSKTVLQYKNAIISNEDLHRLRPRRFLNDSIIDFYFLILNEINLLKKNGEIPPSFLYGIPNTSERGKFECNFPSSTELKILQNSAGGKKHKTDYINGHFFNTMFYILIKRDMERCVRRVPDPEDVQIFQKDYLFIPINITHSHWTLGLILFDSKSFEKEEEEEEEEDVIDNNNDILFFCDSCGSEEHDTIIKEIRVYLRLRFQLEKHGKINEKDLEMLRKSHSKKSFKSSIFLKGRDVFDESEKYIDDSMFQHCFPKLEIQKIRSNDCGIFLMLYSDYFTQKKNWLKKTDKRFVKKKMFYNDHPTHKREEIRELILRFAEIHGTGETKREFNKLRSKYEGIRTQRKKLKKELLQRQINQEKKRNVSSSIELLQKKLKEVDSEEVLREDELEEIKNKMSKFRKIWEYRNMKTKKLLISYSIKISQDLRVLDVLLEKRRVNPSKKKKKKKKSPPISLDVVNVDNESDFDYIPPDDTEQKIVSPKIRNVRRIIVRKKNKK